MTLPDTQRRETVARLLMHLRFPGNPLKVSCMKSMLCTAEWKDNPTHASFLPAAPPSSKHTHLWNLSGWAEEAHETDPVSPHLSKPMGMYRVIHEQTPPTYTLLL